MITFNDFEFNCYINEGPLLSFRILNILRVPTYDFFVKYYNLCIFRDNFYRVIDYLKLVFVI